MGGGGDGGARGAGEYPGISKGGGGAGEYPGVSMEDGGAGEYPEVSRGAGGAGEYPGVSRGRGGAGDTGGGGGALVGRRKVDVCFLCASVVSCSRLFQNPLVSLIPDIFEISEFLKKNQNHYIILKPMTSVFLQLHNGATKILTFCSSLN